MGKKVRKLVRVTVVVPLAHTLGKAEWPIEVYNTSDPHEIIKIAKLGIPGEALDKDGRYVLLTVLDRPLKTGDRIEIVRLDEYITATGTVLFRIDGGDIIVTKSEKGETP